MTVKKGRLHLTVLPQWDRPRTRGDCMTAHDKRMEFLEAWIAKNPLCDPSSAPVPNFEDGINCERPCPWVTCKHHLWLEMGDQGRQDGSKFGSARRLPEDVDPTKMKHTCAIDVAEDEGPLSLDRIGKIFGVTREAIRQMEASGMRKVRRKRVAVLT